MDQTAEILVKSTQYVWWNQPLVIAFVSAGLVAFIGFVTNRYALRPKYCAIQTETCKDIIKEEVHKTETVLCKEIDSVKDSLKEHKKISHEVFARKDVIAPQLQRAREDMIYIRKRLDQLADERDLPPVSVYEEDVSE